MRLPGTLKLKHFTPFFSAVEERAASAEEARLKETGDGSPRVSFGSKADA
jgi:hypothetical protein